jgi:hypothetical protein
MLGLAYAAAAIMALLGAMHLAYTLHDFGSRPRYFNPKDKSLLQAMQLTHTALAPNGRDYWSGILGFHLSHSIGALLFALLIAVATLHSIAWLKPLLVGVGCLYVIISYRCWFNIPTGGIALVTVLMAAGWWVVR